jgi:hypothetical protein
LAAKCAVTTKDPSLQFVTVSGPSVTLSLSADARKKLRAFTAQDVSAGNLGDLTKNDSYMDAMGVALRVVGDVGCLAKAAGTPTDARGTPKAGDWPGWSVTLDADGIPTFTSTK